MTNKHFHLAPDATLSYETCTLSSIKTADQILASSKNTLNSKKKREKSRM